jgi:hypothetical protein
LSKSLHPIDSPPHTTISEVPEILEKDRGRTKQWALSSHKHFPYLPKNGALSPTHPETPKDWCYFSAKHFSSIFVENIPASTNWENTFIQSTSKLSSVALAQPGCQEPRIESETWLAAGRRANNFVVTD